MGNYSNFIQHLENFAFYFCFRSHWDWHKDHLECEDKKKLFPLTNI